MRLIDADALVESIKEELWHWDTVDGINATIVLKQTISDINNMPTIPQPEIIRCRDCKYWEREEPFTSIGRCGIWAYTHRKGSDYCSEAREVSE